MAFGKEIKRLRLKSNLSVKKLADSIGVSPDRLTKWEQRDLNPRYDDTLLIEKYFGVTIEKLMKLDVLPNVQNVPTEDELVNTPDPNGSLKAINSLVESNRVLADSGKIIAEGQLKLVETNSELTFMLKKMILKSTADDVFENPATSDAIFLGLLEVIAGLGVGKEWQSKEEGLAELGRRFYPQIAKKHKSSGNEAGARK